MGSTALSARPRFRVVFPRSADSRELLLSCLLVAVPVGIALVNADAYWRLILLTACVYLIAVNGLDFLRSQAEQMSFGQGAIVGVSAYATALSSSVWNWPGPVSVLLGLGLGMAGGLVTALPSLRVQGFYLGFVTMAGAMAFPEVLLLFSDQTHARTGINVPPGFLHEPLLGSLDLMAVVTVAAALASVWLVYAIRRSSLGRNVRIAGVSPEAAATLGLNPGGLRIIAFAISSTCAAVAGVLYVGIVQYVAAGSFTITLSVSLYFMMVIGGAGTIAGPIAGVALVFILPDVALADFEDYRLLTYGVLVLLVMLLVPDGVVGGIRRLLSSSRSAGVSSDISIASIVDVVGDSGREHGPDHVVLDVDGVSRSFGSVRAIDGATLTIRSGTLHAIVGPNGSGKTTLLNAISGLIDVETGSIRFEGRDISRWSATRRSLAGLARTFQEPRLIEEYTAWENINCGRRLPGQADSAPWMRTGEWSSIRVGELPHGQRRVLELARVLGRGPSLVALDEPAAGLSPRERTQFGHLLRRIVDKQAVTVLMVEHDLDLVWSVADVISVMSAGQVIATGTPEQLRGDKSVSELFLGAHDAQS